MNTETKIQIRNWAIALAPRFFEATEHLAFTRDLARMRKNGYELPLPGIIKRAIIHAEARRINASTFVETGTYLGDTVWYFRQHFSRIYSIEVDPLLAESARRRFRNRSHITILQGDSSSMLATVVAKVQSHALFFLDGHYSAGITGRGQLDCPIWKELECLQALGNPNFSIMIDDARLFGRDKDYPPMNELLSFLRDNFPHHDLKVENDFIYVQLGARKNSTGSSFV